MSVSVALVDGPIDPSRELARFGAAPEEGAVASLTGHVRARDADGAELSALVLETYRGVTLTSMEAIAAAAMDRFAVRRCRVVHRAGRIAPGDAIVFVATAAVHRRAAFDAADYLMDRLKNEAVFWKREESASGTRWIEPRAQDLADLARWTGSAR